MKELEENQNISSDELFSQFINLPNKWPSQTNFEEEFKQNEFVPSRQAVDGKLRGSPSKQYSNSPVKFQEQKDQEYASNDELMQMLKNGVDQKFKSFLDNWEDDIKEWKQYARREVEIFSNYMNSQHQRLKNNLSNELSDFTPVFNAKF